MPQTTQIKNLNKPKTTKHQQTPENASHTTKPKTIALKHQTIQNTPNQNTKELYNTPYNTRKQ